MLITYILCSYLINFVYASYAKNETPRDLGKIFVFSPFTMPTVLAEKVDFDKVYNRIGVWIQKW